MVLPAVSNNRSVCRASADLLQPRCRLARPKAPAAHGLTGVLSAFTWELVVDFREPAPRPFRPACGTAPHHRAAASVDRCVAALVRGSAASIADGRYHGSPPPSHRRAPRRARDRSAERRRTLHPATAATGP